MQTRMPDGDFRSLLTQRLERDPSLDGYYFDNSTVYVFAGDYTESEPVSHLSNVVHELGHVELADTPLGFLHQSLFYVVAVLGRALWTRAIMPVLNKHVGRSPISTRAIPLQQLTEGAPTLEKEQATNRAEADALLEDSAADLRWALAADDAIGRVRAFRTVQSRRLALAEAATLCHEAYATFWQLGERTNLVMTYGNVAAQYGLPSGSLGDIEQFVRVSRAKLQGIWKGGFELAKKVHAKVGESGLLRAVRAAHHFAYDGCELLDMSDSEFATVAASPALSANERLKRVAAEPHLVNANDRDLLRALRDEEVRNETSYQEWTNRSVLGARLLRSVVPLKVQSFSVDDKWVSRLFVPTNRQPAAMLFRSGIIVAANQRHAAAVREDFMAAELVYRVDRTLTRLLG